MKWTDRRKQKAAELYEEMNPNPDNTIECVHKVAKQMGESVNDVYTILSEIGVYVNETGDTSKTTNKSKEDAIEYLKAAVEALGKSIDSFYS